MLKQTVTFSMDIYVGERHVNGLEIKAGELITGNK